LPIDLDPNSSGLNEQRRKVHAADRRAILPLGSEIKSCRV